jgi:hypothetical protein
MSPQKRNKTGGLLVFLTSGLLIVISILIIINKQYVIDQLNVWQYKPTTEISNLAIRSGMSEYGKFLFYASQPKLDATQNFNTECNRVENTTAILGCYTDYKIYIYDVTDTQLDGIREVTAAHETLHAAYDRMSDSEKDKVNVLLETEYKKLENNEDFASLIEYYANSEPGQRDNELYSIIGTEVPSVSSALETNYNKYFSNRQKVVSLYVKYNGVFQNLQNRAKELMIQMNNLSSSISTNIKQYNADATTLNNDIVIFNKDADDGYFYSQAQFNSERSRIVSRVDNLNSTRAAINSDISGYNSLLTEYNSLASQSKKLSNSIDSTLASAPSV